MFGGTGAWQKGDALDVIAETAADVVYLDPPYAATTGYGATYQVLDALLGDGVKSTQTPSLDELLRVSAHVPLLALSYGGPRATLDDLVATVAEHRVIRKALAIPYPRMREIAREATNAASREYIIIAERR